MRSVATTPGMFAACGGGAGCHFQRTTRDCLRGRHGDEAALVGAIDAYQNRRNVAKATINWRFSTQDARSKIHRLYPFNF